MVYPPEHLQKFCGLKHRAFVPIDPLNDCPVAGTTESGFEFGIADIQCLT
jgi:hypothetical protein